MENNKNILINAAKETVGTKPKLKKETTYNEEIEKLAILQKDLRKRQKAPKTNRTKINGKKILLQIRKKSKENWKKSLEEELKEIENVSEESKMFKSMKQLLRGKHEKTFLLDSDKKEILREEESEEITKYYFKNKFYKEENKQNSGRKIVQPLTHPISFQDTKQAIKKLNNNRATGEDNIAAEMIKYAGDNIIGEMVNILNATFEGRTEDTDFIGNRILLALQKPGKPKGVTSSIRPITLLNIIRNIHSNIVLERIQPKLENFISPDQSVL